MKECIHLGLEKYQRVKKRVKDGLVKPHIDKPDSRFSRAIVKGFPNTAERLKQQGIIFENPAENTNLPEGIGTLVSYMSDYLSGNKPLDSDLDISGIDVGSLDALFTQETYIKSINVYLYPLREEEINDIQYSFIAVKLPVGTELKPHLHKKDPEVVVPITEGRIYLGDANMDQGGNYNEADGKVAVNWCKPIDVEPGKPLGIKAAEAHHFEAPKKGDVPFYTIIGLPTSHYKEVNGKKDIVYTTHPNLASPSK